MNHPKKLNLGSISQQSMKPPPKPFIDLHIPSFQELQKRRAERLRIQEKENASNPTIPIQPKKNTKSKTCIIL